MADVSRKSDTDLASVHAEAESLVDSAAAERLAAAIAFGGGQVEVARRSGIPLSSLKTYLKGREVRRTTLVALADACGVTVEWLAAGRGRMNLSKEDRGTLTPPKPPPGYVAVPRFNVAASAGGGALAEHPQVVDYIAYSEEYLRMRLHRAPDTLGLIEARGDSMEPTIRDGDILTVDIRSDQTLENGCLYVLQIADALLVKRVELRTQNLVLHSDNARYSPEIIDKAGAEQLTVIGQVLLVSAPPR